VTIPLKGKDAASSGELFLILPAEGLGVCELDLSTALSNAVETASFEIYLPKYEHDGQVDLKEALTELGLSSLFEHGGTSVLHTSKEESELAYLGSVKQDCLFAMDEFGVRASVKTQSVFYGASLTPEVVEFNRPFVYGIRDFEDNVFFIEVCAMD